jgi:hypothetical protein
MAKDGPSEYVDLRNKFQASLAKIAVNDTKQIGVEECHTVIGKYKGDLHALRVFIGVLTD